MSQTIKDQMHNQILINQNLLNFQDTDSSISDQQQKNQNMPLKIKVHNRQASNIFYSHQQMIKKRRQALKQLSINSKENTRKLQNKNVKCLKGLSNQSSQSNYNVIVDLKSKLAQVLKESQEKSIKINQLQNSLCQTIANLQKLQQTLIEKQHLVNLKEKQISKLNFQNFKLQEEYNTRIKQLQEQLNIANDNLKVRSSSKQVMKNKENETLDNLKIQVQIKNQQIKQLRKNQDKGKKVILQNKKLKKDVERLLLLVEKCAQKQNKYLNKIANLKQIPEKSAKKRSISVGPQNPNKKKNIKTEISSVKCSESTKNQQLDKSLSSIKQKKRTSQSSFCLMGEVQKFLKKWHVAQNNHRFVQSLVDLIHQFTQQCIVQHKTKIQNHYKSLKKEMLRKANQSLNFHQIMKQRQIKIKMSTSLNDQNQKVKSLKSQNQFNIKDQTLSSDNLSILVPASNKKQYENRNKKLLSVSLLEDKSIKKEDISYNNLEQSIRLHQKMSKNQIDRKTNLNYTIEQKIKSIFTQQNIKKSHRKSKTQISNFSKKHQKISTSKKRTISQYKNYRFL